MNLGAWRLRHDGSYTWRSAVGDRALRPRDYQAIATYARRDIPPWRAQLTMGDSFTSGELFDSVGVRGVQLATDDRMLPDSLRGYAPTVRGVAETNARVSIRQNGVAAVRNHRHAGPVRDRRPVRHRLRRRPGRDRDRGRRPRARVLRAVRRGAAAVAPGYDALLGGRRHRARRRRADEPVLVQATLQRGLTNTVTGYGGALGSDGYVAGARWRGAQHAHRARRVRPHRRAHRAARRRTRRPARACARPTARSCPTRGTSFSLASYRYSTSGYYSLREALAARDFALGRPLDDASRTSTSCRACSRRSSARRCRAGATPTFAAVWTSAGPPAQPLRPQPQPAPGRAGGTLYATLSARDYWTREGTDTQFQVGYSNASAG